MPQNLSLSPSPSPSFSLSLSHHASMATSSISAFLSFPAFVSCCAASFFFFFFAFAFSPLFLSSSSISNLHALFSELPCGGGSVLANNRWNPRVLDDRGALLFHSWTDQELFQRVNDAETKLVMAGGTGRDIGHNRWSSFFGSHGNAIMQGVSDSSASPCQNPAHHLHRQQTSKIAFLFLTRGPLPFCSLWKRFFHGHEHLYNIYVHLDPFHVGVFDRRTGVFWGRLIPPDFTERGAPSLVAAERRLLANALLDDPLNHYFALLSDHCIPLRSFLTVYRHMTQSSKSFIEVLSDEPTLRGRYGARGGEDAMLPEVPFKSFRVGSQFFVLLRAHAMEVVLDEKIWNKFKKPCKEADNCYTEEHYFPTLIDMRDRMCTTRSTVTHVDWSQSSNGHPRSYQKGEVARDLIISLRKNDSFLFARKFDDDCLDSLLELSPFIFDEGGEEETVGRR